MKENNIKKDWSELLREKAGSYAPETPQVSFSAIKEKMLAAGAAASRKVALRRKVFGGLGIAASLAALITAGVLLAPDGKKALEPGEKTAVAEADVVAAKTDVVTPEADAVADNNIVTPAASEPIHIVSGGPAVADASPISNRQDKRAIENNFAAEEEPEEALPGDIGDSIPMDAITPEEQAADEVPTSDSNPATVTTETGSAQGSEISQKPAHTIYDITAEPAAKAKPVRKQLQRFSVGANGLIASNAGTNDSKGDRALPNGMMITTDKYGNKYYSFGAPEIHYRYSAPVSAGLSLRYNITNQLYAETGLRFTYLNTWVEPSRARQDLLFAGIPLGIGCTLFDLGNFDIYGSAYGMPSKCIWGREGPSFPANISGIEDIPLMWSAGIAPGVQYTFGNLVSLYAEPTLSYYFKNSKAPQTLYKENPLYFTVNVGVRFNLE